MDLEASLARWRIAGVLPPIVAAALRIRPAACLVRLHDSAIRHIAERRGPDATFVLDYLTETIQQPTLVGQDPVDARRLHLIRLHVEHDRHMLVALKREPVALGSSSSEHLWVATAFPLGNRSLTRLTNRIILLPVDSLADR
jgi:hypothetical protein